MDLLVAVPTACNISSSIDVNEKNTWPWSSNMKDLINSLSMCLYAMQTAYLQKVFCMRGGKKHKSQWLCKAVFEMRCLPGRAMSWRGRLERLLLQAWFKRAIQARLKTNAQKKRVACLRATRNWVDLFEAVFPTAFKHIVPNLVGLSGAGSRCGPTWLSSTSRLVVVALPNASTRYP